MGCLLSSVADDVSIESDDDIVDCNRKRIINSDVPDWAESVIDNFASSYEEKLFSRIERLITVDNVNKFETFVIEMHMDLIEEVMRVHSCSSRRKETLSKSLLDNSVKVTLKNLCKLNVILYGEELIMECPTFGVEEFAGKYFTIERVTRKRFLERYQGTSDGFHTCAGRVLDMVAIKSAVPLMLRVFSREMDCKINDDPVKESKFDFWARVIKLKCVKEFRKIVYFYVENITKNQMLRSCEGLLGPLLKEIKRHKDQNRKLYGEKYYIASYYDY